MRTHTSSILRRNTMPEPGYQDTSELLVSLSAIFANSMLQHLDQSSNTHRQSTILFWPNWTWTPWRDSNEEPSRRFLVAEPPRYSEALSKSGLQDLASRREETFRKFCVKTSKNELFQHWLPRNPPSGYDLRKEHYYTEEKARTERRKNGSPIFMMRRLLLNKLWDLSLKWGIILYSLPHGHLLTYLFWFYNNEFLPRLFDLISL